MATRSPSLSTISLRSALEDAFFSAEDTRLIEKLKAMRKIEETKQALAEVSGITNNEVLSKMMSLNLSAETVASLAVVPLIEVAWADGAVDEKERIAILDGLRASNVPEKGMEFELIESWLQHRPEPRLLEAWEDYVKHLCAKMSVEERMAFRNELLKRTRAVAEASGGFAGIRKVSPAERQILEKLEAAFECE